MEQQPRGDRAQRLRTLNAAEPRPGAAERQPMAAAPPVEQDEPRIDGFARCVYAMLYGGYSERLGGAQ
jgi:hypothetical protein